MVRKVFEKLVNDRLFDHPKCGLFSNFQYGFQSSRSTTNFLTVVSDRIARALNMSEATPPVLSGFGMLVFFINLSLVEFQVRYLTLTFSSKLDWCSCIISIAKTASIKITALVHSMRFLLPEVALYLCKSAIQPCMEYCCHVWAGAPSYYLELLDKLQKQLCRTGGPSLAASLDSLSKCSLLKSFL